MRQFAPQTTLLATMDASKPIAAPRLRLFAQELLALNEDWLRQLTAKVRKDLKGLSSSILGLNGQDFLNDCFSGSTFAYATVQVMEPGERRDKKHFDGGASLLHMGITIFGERKVHLWLDGGETHVLHQRPGSVYIGNMCAVEHQVEHYNEHHDQVLFVNDGAASPSEGPGLLIAVMLRSDVFRHTRARTLKGKPSPVDIYDRVNHIVAEHLATQNFLLPGFARVVVRHDVDDEEPAQKAAGASSRRKRRKAPAGKPQLLTEDIEIIDDLPLTQII